MEDKIVLIEGCRTPFLKSGTQYMDLMAYEIGQLAISGLLAKTGIEKSTIDSVVLGTVITNLKTSNVAREAELTAGIPHTTPCHTVTQACISANRAIASAIGEIKTGISEVVIAGGVDNTSDTPIGFRREMRKKLFKAQKLKSIKDQLKFISSLRIKDFLPEKPTISEFTTGKTMGQDCDTLAAKYKVSRKEQDEYAILSHNLADKAWEDGHLSNEVVPVQVGKKFNYIHRDNGIRPGSSLEKLSKLRPAFDKKNGTLTAANSSYLTDGAAVVLLMKESKAKELGLKPKAEIIEMCFTGQELKEELLLGPVFSMSKVLRKANLSLAQMDVIEIHEAFAGQVLANINCLESDEFAKTKLNQSEKTGLVERQKLNRWGGSLAIGHPFGATGARLLNTTANRLIQENGNYGILSACAAGAHGHAMIIKKYN
ncbi:MAG: thiolase family protein [Bacteroidota bacterium]|nr:thiolase family protein [Bacteroidota bacterium]